MVKEGQLAPRFTLTSDAGDKISLGVERATFVIDADGKVTKVMRKVTPATHADDVLEALLRGGE